MRKAHNLASALRAMPTLSLGTFPTAVHDMPRLRAALGGGPRLLIKRDDANGFAFGGNKVRKLRLVGARARSDGADTLITAGAIQSNHARVTAATAVTLGMKCVLVVNGRPPARPTGNALLDHLLGAQIEYVDSREARAPAMQRVAERLRSRGAHPFEIPIGASIPLGAAAFVGAMAELLEQIPAPTAIVHASSSGGTQAGLVAGCALLEAPTRILAISADESAPVLAETVGALVRGVEDLFEAGGDQLGGSHPIDVDDRFVGAGYGVPTEASIGATELLASTEAIFLDPVYTAKAMAGLISYVREGRFRESDTVLFWHTGGQPALFACDE
jgi:L-cysteate sulfo-lyase